MEGLVEAAKKEGELNVIALPPDWANYGAIIKAFADKYGIKVNSAQPDAASQDEINAANQQKGKSTAPDVFDLGQSVALANTAMFAPYKVATFDDISSRVQGSRRHLGQRLRRLHVDRLRLVQGAAGHRASTICSSRSTRARSRSTAIRRRPARRSPACMMVALSQGGSADDIAPGVEFFRKLKEAGNFLPVDPTPATIESGQTPVVIDWDYLNAAETKKLPTWKVVVPPNAAVAGYYYQAINKDAPHPAAARLWQEFLYSDEGQNLYLRRRCPSGARRQHGRRRAPSTRRPADAAAAGRAADRSSCRAGAERRRRPKYLADNWAKAIG